MTALPTLKLRVLPTFPSSIVGSGPITVTKTAGIYTISFSITPFGSIAPPPANYLTDFLLGYDSVAGTFFKLPLSLVLSGSVAQTGASYTYAAGDQALVKKRSNSAAAMVDTLPGTGTAVMAAGWWTRIVNTDAAAILAIGVGTGATLDGQAAGNFVYLGPGQAATVYSDGTSYITLEKPDRCRLGAATTFYCGGAGSSANNAGLTTGTGALATIQSAINLVGQRLDLNGNNCTIQIADGNYTENLSLVPYIGRGSQGHTGPVMIQGNSGNITAVSLQPATGDVITATETGGFEWAFQNLRLAPATGQTNIDANAWVVFGAGITFHTTTSNHVVIQNGGIGEFTANPNITGPAGSHLLIHSGGIGIYTGGNTVTITNTPLFASGFVTVVRGGKLIAASVTYSGAVAAVTPKWSRDTTSIIFTGGVDPDTIFPGTVNGSVSPSLPVNEGGTGAATFTNHGVLLGKGTSAIAATAVGATGTVLRGQTGADPVYGAVVLTTDITGILPIANGGTNDAGTAWAAYTPSVASGTGSLTTASATGRFKQIGKTTFFQAAVTITTNGTGATNIQVGLPATAANAKYAVGGFESVTGKHLSGAINASAALAIVTFYDNTYPGASGAVLIITGVYEAA